MGNKKFKTLACKRYGDKMSSLMDYSYTSYENIVNKMGEPIIFTNGEKIDVLWQNNRGCRNSS